jgi:hypothetical protein
MTLSQTTSNANLHYTIVTCSSRRSKWTYHHHWAHATPTGPTTIRSPHAHAQHNTSVEPWGPRPVHAVRAHGAPARDATTSRPRGKPRVAAAVPSRMSTPVGVRVRGRRSCLARWQRPVVRRALESQATDVPLMRQRLPRDPGRAAPARACSCAPERGSAGFIFFPSGSVA